MFPKAEDCPPIGFQPFIVRDVTLSIPANLRLPPFAVAYRDGFVFGAAVPVAAVEEHGESYARENDVRLTAQPMDRTSMFVEPQTSAVKRGPKTNLGVRVPRTVGLH